MSALSKAEQEAVYNTVRSNSAKRRASEEREREQLRLLTQQNEILLGVWAQVANRPDPDPDFSDWIFSTNREIERAEVAREAGMRIEEVPTEEEAPASSSSA